MAASPARLERVAAAMLVVLGALLPFELKEPLFRFGPLAVTNLEIALYLAVAVWAAHRALAWPRSFRWTAAHTAVAAWAGALLLSAAFAPVERAAALKFALRSLGGCALFFAAADLVRAPNRAAGLLAALAAGGALSAGAALAEAWLPGAAEALLAFKTQTTLVGSFVRAGGTFQYANTAAMYWEAALLLAAGLCGWGAVHRPRTAWPWAALAATLLIVEAVVLSASRAALGVAGLGLAALAALGWKAARPLRLPALLGLAALGLLALIGLAANPWLALRLRSEQPTAWYRTGYTVTPSTLNLQAGEVITVSVTVRNEGLVAWPTGGPEAVSLSYHWRDPGENRTVIFEGWRTPLPEEVPPGGQVTLAAPVLAPSEPGSYTLQWDMVQEGVLWFSAQGDDTGDVPAQVNPAPSGAALPPPPVHVTQPAAQDQPSRLELWGAGWRMWLDRPLLGVGPDNFRHLYGSTLGLARFDQRVHANNLYVETLATLGLAGALALAGLIFALARSAWRGWPALREPGARALAAGLLAGLAAFLAHGLLDYFFEFTPTYGLFWLLAGAAVGWLGRSEQAE